MALPEQSSGEARARRGTVASCQQAQGPATTCVACDIGSNQRGEIQAGEQAKLREILAIDAVLDEDVRKETGEKGKPRTQLDNPAM